MYAGAFAALGLFVLAAMPSSATSRDTSESDRPAHSRV